MILGRLQGKVVDEDIDVLHLVDDAASAPAKQTDDSGSIAAKHPATRTA
jgi:hypothetical protein